MPPARPFHEGARGLLRTPEHTGETTIMSERTSLVDACIISGMDDIDLVAMEKRLDLLLETCVGAAYAGTEGVSNGFKITAPDNGFQGTVFVHDDSVSLWTHHSGVIRANASFQMPADDLLKQALEKGEEGVRIFVRQWRNVMRTDPSKHVPVLDPDGNITGHINRVGRIIDAVVSSANPDFPSWKTIDHASATWSSPATMTVSGKQILSNQTEDAVLDLLPRIVEVKPHSVDRGYVMLPYETTHKFTPMDPLSVMRVLAEESIVLPTRPLRKVGMEKRP